MTIPKYILPEKDGTYKFMVFNMGDDSYIRFHQFTIEETPQYAPLPQHKEIIEAFAKEIGIYAPTKGGGMCLLWPDRKRALFHCNSVTYGKFEKKSLEDAIAGLEKEYNIEIE